MAAKGNVVAITDFCSSTEFAEPHHPTTIPDCQSEFTLSSKARLGFRFLGPSKQGVKGSRRELRPIHIEIAILICGEDNQCRLNQG
jgi:hypothetical protein